MATAEQFVQKCLQEVGTPAEVRRSLVHQRIPA